MKAKTRLALAAAVAIFGVAVAFLPKPASAAICAKTDCYVVYYEDGTSQLCCHYLCPSGDTWVCR